MTKYLPLLLLFLSCNTKQKIAKQYYPDTIGNIEYNESIDGDIERCGFLPGYITTSFMNSYYGAGGMKYKGELSAIKAHIIDNYESPKIKNETGFVVIRFLVNCKGKTGMFRLSTTDLQLNKNKFNNKITDQLLRATKSLDKWQIALYNDNAFDYYQYLTFKIVDSELQEITP